MENKDVYILKMSGERVVFSKEKLRHSLVHSGAQKSTIDFVIQEIENNLNDDITTKEVYKKAYNLLRKKSRINASKYKLKQGIMELGPTGFPFENFIGELLKHQGYKTQVGVIVKGECVNHEVDVVAEKGNKHYMIECKFHSSFSTKCHVKNPLYIHSRFLDIEKQWKKQKNHENKFHQGWLVNNTRFSEDALKYGICAGLKLLSWDCPLGNSLKEQISLFGLYPITCLSTLNQQEKKLLLQKNIVLCKQLCSNPIVLNQIGIVGRKYERVLSNAKGLCTD